MRSDVLPARINEYTEPSLISRWYFRPKRSFTSDCSNGRHSSSLSVFCVLARASTSYFSVPSQLGPPRISESLTPNANWISVRKLALTATNLPPGDAETRVGRPPFWFWLDGSYVELVVHRCQAVGRARKHRLRMAANTVARTIRRSGIGTRLDGGYLPTVKPDNAGMRGGPGFWRKPGIQGLTAPFSPRRASFAVIRRGELRRNAR